LYLFIYLSVKPQKGKHLFQTFLFCLPSIRISAKERKGKQDIIIFFTLKLA